MNDKEMQGNESKEFNQSAYIQAYMKEKYKDIKIHCKLSEYDIIDKFCKDLQISRQKFLINCALYIINHDMIDDVM